MLNQEILDALKQYTADMRKDVTLVMQTGEHGKREELAGFLSDIASASPRIRVGSRDLGLRSPASFALEADGEATGIVFSGIPGGHEFNSLVLAILQASGTPLKLDQGIKDVVAGIDEAIRFEVFVSLSCHNCPDVVQALNQFALLNPGISSEMIDGGVFPALAEERNIQSVPVVYLNGEVFANGKVEPAQLLEKLMKKFPQSRPREGGGSRLPLQDVTVVGGGPAGVAAAIYAARKGLKVTLIADRVGGQVKDTMGIENFISVPGTTGPELTQALGSHMKDYEITVKEHIKVDRIVQGSVKSVHLSSGELVRTRTVIIATGARWRELGVPGEKENLGSGVAYCPHCDGPFFKGRDVAVIGGGNSGLEAALDLAGIVRSVTVLEFQPELKADRILVDRAAARDNITILKNAATRRILARDGKVYALEYTDRGSDEVHELGLEGVFVQIGLVPNSAFVKDLVETNRYGEIIVNERGETGAPGIFACGDVTTVPYKQIVVAMSEGSKAALAAFDYLLKHAPDAGERQALTADAA